MKPAARMVLFTLCVPLAALRGQPATTSAPLEPGFQKVTIHNAPTSMSAPAQEFTAVTMHSLRSLSAEPGRPKEFSEEPAFRFNLKPGRTDSRPSLPPPSARDPGTDRPSEDDSADNLGDLMNGWHKRAQGDWGWLAREVESARVSSRESLRLQEEALLNDPVARSLLPGASESVFDLPDRSRETTPPEPDESRGWYGNPFDRGQDRRNTLWGNDTEQDSDVFGRGWEQESPADSFLGNP